MVFSAHTAGSGADQKFITLIAQPDLYGNVLVLLKNVTDAAHLDDTPRMRLIDPVDAMADNRGELLFELRGDTQRQFALYLVLRGQVRQLFVTGGGSTGSLGGE
jgi:CRP-like cAMP-binding protein